MGKMLAVIYYEYKMQMQRPATWGVLFAGTSLSLLDHVPSPGNLLRLEFLEEPAYFIYRTMSLNGLILMFGLLFLLAERFPLDRRTGMKLLLLSHAIEKWQYIGGKLLGGFLYAFSVLEMFLVLNMAVYVVAAPFPVSLAACMVPLIKTIFISAFPVSLFVSFCSAALPAMMDIRLFYLLAAVLFGVNAGFVGSANAVPFYLITSGDLIRLIWVHPKWPFTDLGSIFANGAFLMGGGILSGGLLFLKRGFWRSE